MSTVNYGGRHGAMVNNRTFMTYDETYARALIDLFERRIHFPYHDGFVYEIVCWQWQNNDEFVEYGGTWGGEPGLYRVARPGSWTFTIKRVT